MKETKSKYRQSLADVALRSTGSVEDLVAIGMASGVGLSEEPGEGHTVTIPDGTEEDPKVVARYEAEGVEPATWPSVREWVDCMPCGIGYMGVEEDFVVS